MAELLNRLLERADAVRSEVLAEVRSASEDELEFRLGERWSVRQILIHLGNWEELATTSIRQLRRGEKPPSVVTDAFNREEQARRAHLDLAGALAYLQETRREARALAEEVTDAEVEANPGINMYARWAPPHETQHLHQIREMLCRARGHGREAAIHYLAYERQHLLNFLPLELMIPEELKWRPEPEKWSIREHLIHLSVWDRHCARYLAELNRGRELADPTPPGGLDPWNREQVAARAHWGLSRVLHEFGAARGAMEAVILELSDRALEESEGVFTEYRNHDLHHYRAIRAIRTAWRERK